MSKSWSVIHDIVEMKRVIVFFGGGHGEVVLLLINWYLVIALPDVMIVSSYDLVLIALLGILKHVIIELIKRASRMDRRLIVEVST